MRSILIVACAFLVSACDEAPKIESVDFLVANPERLVELRRLCKADHAQVGDAQCNAVAEATRRRFMNGGTVRDVQPDPPVDPSSAASDGAAQ